mmetsp:Transcript_15608/g.22881  ORF Transcript_15608/g.22881 Transcript_15608/m.22881 type:complete len:114 (+) Transcript_15608:205-546(+)
MNAVFEERCKKLLIQPTVVTEHPVVRASRWLSLLAKPHRSKPVWWRDPSGPRACQRHLRTHRPHRPAQSTRRSGSHPSSPLLGDRIETFSAVEKKALDDEEVCGMDEDLLLAL